MVITPLVLVLNQSVNSLTCYTCDNCPEPFNGTNVGTRTEPNGNGYSCSVSRQPAVVIDTASMLMTDFSF